MLPLPDRGYLNARYRLECSRMAHRAYSLKGNLMARRTKIAVSALAAPALGLALAACQPHMTAPSVHEAAAPDSAVQEAAAPAGELTVAEVQDLVVGNTVFVRTEASRVTRAEYFSPDGTVLMKAKPDFMGMSFSFKGTYHFDEQEGLCFDYPTLPVSPKEYCEEVVRQDDGGYGLGEGGVVQQILDGDHLDELN